MDCLDSETELSSTPIDSSLETQDLKTTIGLTDSLSQLTISSETDSELGSSLTSFQSLDYDLTELVLSYLSTEDKFKFEGVCREWQTFIFNKGIHLVIDSTFLSPIINEDMVDLEAFEAFLKKSYKTLYLDIICNDPNITNKRKVFELFAKYCRFLKEFKFDSDYLCVDSSPDIQLLANFIANQKRLELLHLNFLKTQINEDIIRKFSENDFNLILKSIGKLSHLKRLTLPLITRWLPSFLDSLRELSSKFSELKALDLSIGFITDSQLFYNTFRALIAFKQLIKLKFVFSYFQLNGGNELHDLSSDLLNGFPNLKSLSMQTWSQFTDQSFHRIDEQMPNLEEFYCSAMCLEISIKTFDTFSRLPNFRRLSIRTQSQVSEISWISLKKFIIDCQTIESIEYENKREWIRLSKEMISEVREKNIDFEFTGNPNFVFIPDPEPEDIIGF